MSPSAANFNFRSRSLLAASIGAMAASLGAGPAMAATETVIYRFTGGHDGAYPQAPLVIDGAGNLYGTTTEFTYGSGNIFRLAPPSLGSAAWHFDVLHTFASNFYGLNPGGLLLDAASGALFGATEYGGRCAPTSHDCCCTAFSLAPPTVGSTVWGLSQLYLFGKPNVNAD